MAGGRRQASLPATTGLGRLVHCGEFRMRPTFTLAALLAFPLFWPQIRALGHRSVRTRPHQAVAGVARAAGGNHSRHSRRDASDGVNMVRFDSPFNFGNAYQFSISDMTRYTTPSADMPANIWYYLFLPLRFMDRFPWLAGSPAPMPQWVITR